MLVINFNILTQKRLKASWVMRSCFFFFFFWFREFCLCVSEINLILYSWCIVITIFISLTTFIIRLIKYLPKSIGPFTLFSYGAVCLIIQTLSLDTRNHIFIAKLWYHSTCAFLVLLYISPKVIKIRKGE